MPAGGPAGPGVTGLPIIRTASHQLVTARTVKPKREGADSGSDPTLRLPPRAVRILPERINEPKPATHPLEGGATRRLTKLGSAAASLET
jgi:hypothetical protein